MASEQCIRNLTTTVDRLNAVDSVKLLRKELGVESLDSVFAEELEKIRSLAAFAEQHAATVHDEYVEQARRPWTTSRSPWKSRPLVLQLSTSIDVTNS